MKRILGVSLVVLLLGAGCDELCFSDDCVNRRNGDEYCGNPTCSPYGNNMNGNWNCNPSDCDPHQNYPWCESDGNCFEGEKCVNGECKEDEPSWCSGSGECPEGQICSLTNECRDIVLNCPLTEECLADPEGYVPDWVGIDPLYMGEATGSGITARLEFLVDFYMDHFYGEAVVEANVPGGGTMWLNLIVTGNRSEALLDGMIIDRDASERWFDATFEAQLVTASEIVGTVLVSSDDGTFMLDLQLWRISPCGCETTACTVDADCPADQECQDNQCVDPCVASQECCLASDCVAGDDCVNGTCRTPCSDSCDCDTGEACVSSYCQPAE